jgi:hypothetical protein
MRTFGSLRVPLRAGLPSGLIGDRPDSGIDAEWKPPGAPCVRVLGVRLPSLSAFASVLTTSSMSSNSAAGIALGRTHLRSRPITQRCP